MTVFLTEDFLLHSKAAQYLYHEHAKQMPIFDYHSHLPADLIATNHQFKNLYEIWLKGDHYKWRVMRANGIVEKFCTGDACDYEKFLAYASTVPYTIGNPIYHWTHLELRRPFGITDLLLNSDNAQQIWNRTNQLLEQPEFTTQGIIQQMNVKMIGTTDDPIDSLEHHQKIHNSALDVKVLPSFRPDRALNLQKNDFLEYLLQLGEVSNIEINSFMALKAALSQRIEYFAEHGCKISDHSLETVSFLRADDQTLNAILQKRLTNVVLTEPEITQFKTELLCFLGSEYAKHHWVQQYHIGALRNNNSRLFQTLGADIGCDSINDTSIAEPLSKLLDTQDQENALPRTILYCLNPRDNEVIGSMVGNFQSGEIVGKIQFGSGWWFNDQKDGMIRQLMQLSQLGLLSRFVGMLTDSRSFLSFTRHEYFRRILCQMVGQWVDDGEAPNDMELLGNMIENICYHNAEKYFNIQ